MNILQRLRRPHLRRERVRNTFDCLCTGCSKTFDAYISIEAMSGGRYLTVIQATCPNCQRLIINVCEMMTGGRRR